MGIRQAFASALIADTGVSEHLEGRVYWLVAPPRSPLPHATYQVVGRDRVRKMEAPTGLTFTDVQVDIFGTTPATTENAAEAIRDAFDHAHNTTLGTGPHAVSVAHMFLMTDHDMYEVPEDGGSTGLFRILQEWRILHSESVPNLSV